MGVGHQILDADRRILDSAGLVPGNRGDPPAVRGPRHTFYCLGVGADDNDLGAGLCVPDPHCPVIRPRWWGLRCGGGGSAEPRDCAGPSLHRQGCCASLTRRPAAGTDSALPGTWRRRILKDATSATASDVLRQ
jgi:hypothetical protein